MATAELTLTLEDGELVAEMLTARAPEEVESDASEGATDDEEEEEDIPLLAAADAPLTTPVLHGRLACLFHSELFRTHV